jgi:glycosyltransferase involved in cell wall biosynthesis
MKVGIDGNEANILRRVGSNIYAYEVLHALAKKNSSVHYTVFLKQPPVADMPAPSANWSYRVITPKKLWTQWRLPLELYLKGRSLDVFYTPSHYAPRFSPVPTIMTLFDLSFLSFPNLFLKYERGAVQLRDWTAYSVKNAARVIAISRHTRADAIKYYKLHPEKVRIAYPGINRRFYSPASLKKQQQVIKKYHTTPKFLLYVGTIQPRKNLNRLLSAFEKLPAKFDTFRLVIAGQKGWLYDDFISQINRSPKKSKIILTGFVDQADLPALYTAASCTCLIGLYEGFGIPPAESLACGTIPVVSSSSSLPEVVGEAGIIVDPYSISSIKHGLISALEETPAKTAKRLKLAKDHLSQFNWNRSAAIIEKVFYEVATQR